MMSRAIGGIRIIHSFIHSFTPPTDISPGPRAHQTCAGGSVRQNRPSPCPQGTIRLEGEVDKESQPRTGGEDDA